MNELQKTEDKDVFSDIETTPITAETVKKYICPLADDKELTMFLALCKKQNLNPFLNDIYLVKYAQGQKASMVVAKDVFLKRANKQPDYRGFKAGIIVDRKEDIIYQDGAFMLPTDKILGGWCEVYRENKEPLRIEVSFDEYKGVTKAGQLNRQWASKSATMIRKVAVVQAHREAYPEEFQGLYDESELGAIQRGQDQAKPHVEMPKATEPKTVEAEVVYEAAPKTNGSAKLVGEIYELLTECTRGDVDNAKDLLESLSESEKEPGVRTFAGVPYKRLKQIRDKVKAHYASLRQHLDKPAPNTSEKEEVVLEDAQIEFGGQSNE